MNKGKIIRFLASLPLTGPLTLSALPNASNASGQWIEWPVAAGGNGHEYLPVIVASPISWDQAARAALAQGGYLATLTSKAENDFVFGLVSSPAYFYRGEMGPLLGGYQPPGSAEPGGGWTWVTGEPWSFTNWAGGQPDNGGQPEGILHFWYGNAWNDQSTNGLNFISYVIERDGPCTPRKAKATAQLFNGFVVDATVTDSGCGYTNPPIVLVQGGGGSGAIARATVTDGRVTRVQIVDAGCCYTNTPRIIVSAPPSVPTVEIMVNKVKVVQNVVLGWKYVLESSTNSTDWAATGPAFVADTDPVETEFESDGVNRLFRLRVVP